MLIPLVGLSLGLLALTRPLTALGVAFPFFLHGSFMLFHRDWQTRKQLISVGLLAGGASTFLFVWQYGVTGSALTDPYTLWWSFDRVGFGPGIGIQPGGNSLVMAFSNMGIMLNAARKDLFGWGTYSWLFLPFGLWVMRRNLKAWLLAGTFLSLVGIYTLYWAQVTRFGPRYYYEGLYGLTLVSAAGIFWLAGNATQGRMRSILAAILVIGLIGYDIAFYLPNRLGNMRDLYGISRSQLVPFLTPQAQAMTPALVFVHLEDGITYGNLGKDWPRYGGLLELEDPWLTGPFIFAVSHGVVEDQALAADYPGRRVIYYDPGAPNTFYDSPR